MSPRSSKMKGDYYRYLASSGWLTGKSSREHLQRLSQAQCSLRDPFGQSVGNGGKVKIMDTEGEDSQSPVVQSFYSKYKGLMREKCLKGVNKYFLDNAQARTKSRLGRLADHQPHRSHTKVLPYLQTENEAYDRGQFLSFVPTAKVSIEKWAGDKCASAVEYEGRGPRIGCRVRICTNWDIFIKTLQKVQSGDNVLRQALTFISPK
ncbi:hypothetical protein HPP92_028895 [Vanilla planifolia]|uniref:Uncharacterized protein n=1 Tax=Vanilla planifolia TaxID=51239 RepID=A0A835U4Z3_VANPL|nr:hypothetical protein HPP92_028895 [Vanilla planifolia]KAG0446326.1 hypothetical protein HPP92_028885 [Vanilla planifolia]